MRVNLRAWNRFGTGSQYGPQRSRKDLMKVAQYEVLGPGFQRGPLCMIAEQSTLQRRPVRRISPNKVRQILVGVID
jgi:hypothetical protein